jgi:phospholipase C
MFQLWRRVTLVALLLALLGVPGAPRDAHGAAAQRATATPIEHLVVIFQENSSFDRAFATYPTALNPPGEPRFEARPGTPSVNGLGGPLLTHNPNGVNPFRIARAQAYTCDQDHEYSDELKARNGGLLNRYVEFGAGGPGNDRQYCARDAQGRYVTDMGYFDGNTVTALWMYAQHFAMSDNHFATMPGQSTRGALNLVAGDVSGVLCAAPPADGSVPAYSETPVPDCGGPAASASTPAPSNGILATLVDDTDPYWDTCSRQGQTVALQGRTIGDLLSEAGVTWGWFQGGFADCGSAHSADAFDRYVGVDPATDTVTRVTDYVPHHNPFQYFAQRSNPMHTPPASVMEVGRDGPANHLYDLEWFWRAADAGSLPAVSFLKARASQDGHPGNSNPLDEQVWLVETLNRLQQLPQWPRMAIVIAWDDSDGWYDHVMAPVVNQSSTPLDVGCGDRTDGPGGRCAYGPRLPLVAISPWAKENYVAHSLTDQTSILRLIEDNWLGGLRVSDLSFDRIAGSLLDLFDFSGPRMRRLILDPETGLPAAGAGVSSRGEQKWTSAIP